MEAERLDIPCVIGGEGGAHRRPRPGGDAAPQEPRARRRPPGRRGRGASRRSRRPPKPGTTGRRTPWEERAAVLLRAAELLAGPWRTTLVAATMLNQSKTAHQAEIDAAAELIDFFRFNVEFMTRIYEEQPISSPGVWNRLEYRPLEGFVFAVSPFNFTAIGGNLTTSAGADGQHRALEARLDRRALGPLHVAALAGSGPAGRRDQPRLRARRGGRRPGARKPRPRRHPLHRLDRASSRTCGRRSARTSSGYRNYPRIVGETGGKDFIVAHPSADVDSLATAIVRGSFEYQGQKCSAASRVYAPVEPLAGAARAARRPGRRAQGRRRRRLRELHGRGDRRRARSRRRRRRSRRRARTATRRSSSAAATTTARASSSSRP